MIEINLIPDVKQELLKAQRMRTVVISGAITGSIIAAGLVVALVIYVFAVQSVRSSFLDDAIKTNDAKLAEVEDSSKILTIQNQLKLISELNANKKMDSRVFDVLAAVIPPEPNSVQISMFNIDADTSTITLEGQTRAYDSMEIFKKTLDSAIVTYVENEEDMQVKLAADVSTGDISYGEDASGVKVVRFSLNFVYPEELFSPTIPLVTIKLSQNGNVTDSYLGIPKSMFVDRAEDVKE